MARQEELKFASNRGRRQWLIANAKLTEATIIEGKEDKRREIPVTVDSQRLLLRCLLDFQRNQDWCWPSQKTISSWCNCSRRTTQRVISACKSAGLILGQNVFDGTRKLGRYKICFSVLSELAKEDVTIAESVEKNLPPDHYATGEEDYATERTHYATGQDHYATVADRTNHSNQSINQSSESGGTKVLDLGERGKDVAYFTKQVGRVLRPVKPWQIAVIRQACQMMVDGDISQHELTEAIKTVQRKRNEIESPVGYFRRCIENFGGRF